jgi:hypothetical protein
MRETEKRKKNRLCHFYQYDQKYLYRLVYAYIGIFFDIIYLLSARVQRSRYNCEIITEISRIRKSNAKKNRKI